MTLNVNELSSITMLSLTVMNDNDIVLTFNATIRILSAFGRITILIIRIRPNSKDPRFGTALIFINIVCIKCFL